MVNHYDEADINFQAIEHQLQKMSFIAFFLVSMKSSLNLEVSPTHLNPLTGNFRDITQPHV